MKKIVICILASFLCVFSYAQGNNYLTRNGKWEKVTTQGDVISGTKPTTLLKYKCEYGEFCLDEETDSWDLHLNRKMISGVKVNPTRMYQGNFCSNVIIALLDKDNNLVSKYEDEIALGDFYSRLWNIVPKKKKKKNSDKKGALVVNQYLCENEGAVVIRFVTSRDNVFDFYVPCINKEK